MNDWAKTLGAARVAAKRLGRAFFLAVWVVVLVGGFAAEAAARVPRAYAGIVVDAKTGKELYASAADELRYPASVTKVMTLYILFEELKAGNLKLNSTFSISKFAAGAPPTKLGLRAGSTIKVEDAIKALVTLSANDIARAVAENISGSEAKFAKRMTATAKALGMTHTNYHNASGLPDSRQLTTVRDQARLGAAIFEHFPTYYAYFQTRSFSYGRKSYGNHNQLLGSQGIDGIKTGYINASGYNLLTAARKDDRHIIVVGFGFNTGNARNAKVSQLVKTYLPKARRGTYLAEAQVPRPRGVGGSSPTRVAAAPVSPLPRPDILGLPASDNDRLVVASVEPDAPVPFARPIDLVPEDAVEAVNLLAGDTSEGTDASEDDVLGAWISRSLRLASDEDIPSPQLLPPARIGQTAKAEPIDLASAADGGWVIQVGAAPNEVGARSLLGDATRKMRRLVELQAYVERIDKDGQTFYRARFTGLGGRTEARSLCDALKKEKMSCLALQS